ncbi:MAG: hypothetical protein R3F59_20830 [Myxococcota bacterium]
MPFELTESAAIDRFRFHRWPDTGFRCRLCQHPHGTPVGNRPRVFRCTARDCRAQSSVTAGTAAHGSKLSLLQWEQRGEMHDAPRDDLPSAREVARTLGVAPSTAWLLNQKFAALTSLLQKGIQHYRLHGLTVPIALRPPRTGQLGHTRLEFDKIGFREALVCLPDHGPGFTLSHLRAGDALTYGRADLVAAVDYMRHEVAGWLQSRIEKFHDKVSLRWLPRWVDAYLHLYNVNVRPTKCPKIHWRELLTFVHRLPLRLLDPWLEPRPPDPPSLAWLRANVGKA